jgi:hypothetical protein
MSQKELDEELQFESAEDSTGILSHFDDAKGKFAFSKDSPFWYGVARAHADGIEGQGRRIAIIDSAFDLTRGGLRSMSIEVRMKAPAGERTEHGTAVALLVAEVAPKASLHLYEVSRNNKPGSAAIAQALQMATESDADIINLSIGHPFGAPTAGAAVALPEHRCELAAATEAAIAAGKVVIAAVGNAAGRYLCPAQSSGVTAVGYNSELRSTLKIEGGGFQELSNWQRPSFGQSLQPAFTILQPPGVLGSSFAAPLASGLAALAHDPRELAQLKTSIFNAATASEISGLLAQLAQTPNANDAKEMQQLVDSTRRYFEIALQTLPHRPNPQTEPRCPACAILTYSTYVNAGEFVLHLSQFEIAESLLRYALWLAPWSPDAQATLGRAVECKAEQLLANNGDREKIKAWLAEARELYLEALRWRPNHSVYVAELEKIRQYAAQL